ncbi:acyl-CoA carboxylase epsilon subunit [Brachybacterium sp. J153]|uniref:acyl-CoA carboxylase epsilon subunit n=1 Tax=Brachybacterium sp. J153 TaxID=3116488 RepID=UPI002E75EC19|nr:hypothetical protein [Brachybacterium sp. J153]MEE1616860.1 hypothetical protein [Brachybacterium sp. J153]
MTAAGPAIALEASGASEASEASSVDAPRADVRLVAGRLEPAELAAIAVVVSAMSVTSRLEAEERSLAVGGGAESGWAAPVHTHAGGHRERLHPSASAWMLADR